MLVRTLALGLLMSALAVIGPASATAEAGVDLGLTGFSEMVVDSEHEQIFISEGHGGGVVVLELDGSRKASLSELAGAQGLWLDTSTDTLWVAASESSAVGEVDTATLDVTTHETGAGSCPHDVTSGEGGVWFADECGDSSIAALDLSTDQVTTFAEVEAERWRLAMSPEVPGRLFALAEDSALLAGFEVTGGAEPTLSAQIEPVTTQGGNDLVMMADGRGVVLAGGSIHSTEELQIQLGQYDKTSSIALRADGRVGGVHDGDWRTYDEHPLAIVPPQVPFAQGAWAGEAIESRGIAWGDVALYAVTRRSADGDYLLHAVLPKRRSSVSISTARSSYWYGSNVNVNVRLNGAKSSRVVAVYARPQGKPQVLVTRSAVPQRGLVVKFRLERKTTFTVVYDENVDTFGARDEVTLRVPTSVDMFAEGRPKVRDELQTYRVGQRATFRVEVRPHEPSHRVVTNVWAEGYGRRLLIGRSDYLRLSDRGVARVYVDGLRAFVGWRLQIRATWYRTKDSGPARRSHEVDFRFVL